MKGQAELRDDTWVITLPVKERYTTVEAARRIGCSASILIDYVRHHGLKCEFIQQTMGKKRKLRTFKHEDLVEWLEWRRTEEGQSHHNIEEKFAVPTENKWVFTMPKKKYYTAAECSRILGISTSRIYTFRKTGAMEFVRIKKKGSHGRRGVLHAPHKELLGMIKWRQAKKAGFDQAGELGGYEVIV